MRLIELLEQKRLAEELRVWEFGRLFGYTGHWWSQVKHGKRSLSPDVARRAKQIWPDLTEAVDHYLLYGTNNAA